MKIMKKANLLVIVLTVIIASATIVGLSYAYSGSINKSMVLDEPLVGRDRDEHNCIGSAGYSWCEEKQKCIRPWEEDCEDYTH